MRTFLLASLAAVSIHASTARAATVYDEAVSGDLSNDRTAPTLLTLDAGANALIGRTGAGDRDYLSLTLPTGYRLDALVVRAGTTAAGGGSFIGVQAGSQVTVLPSALDATGLLGWYLYGAGDIGNDILASMGIPNQNSTGFTPPLEAGTYAFWIQELGAQGTYNFEFQVAAVPEPASALLLLGGLGMLAFAYGRRRTS